MSYTPRNSPLIQHLCSHIATLEQLNAKLNEDIAKFDK